MSMFLPEGVPSSSDGVASVTPSSPAVTDADTALMKRVFGAAAATPNAIPDGFMGYLIDFIQTSHLTIPIGQVFGFQNFLSTQVTVATAPFIFTEESRTSSTYGDLTTTGPTLTGLDDGQYIVMFGCSSRVVSGEAGMSVQINAGAVDDNDACISQITTLVSVGGARAKTMKTGGNNTITAKYRSLDNVSAANFARRWLIAIRFANA